MYLDHKISNMLLFVNCTTLSFIEEMMIIPKIVNQLRKAVPCKPIFQ